MMSVDVVSVVTNVAEWDNDLEGCYCFCVLEIQSCQPPVPSHYRPHGNLEFRLSPLKPACISKGAFHSVSYFLLTFGHPPLAGAEQLPTRGVLEAF